MRRRSIKSVGHDCLINCIQQMMLFFLLLTCYCGSDCDSNHCCVLLPCCDSNHCVYCCLVGNQIVRWYKCVPLRIHVDSLFIFAFFYLYRSIALLMLPPPHHKHGKMHALFFYFIFSKMFFLFRFFICSLTSILITSFF